MLAVKQLYEHDCGFACVKFLLANCNKDKNYLYLPQVEEKGAYSFQDLVNVAQKYGMTLFGFEMKDKREIDIHIALPVIISLYGEGTNKHAVVLVDRHRNHYTIYDPAKGKRKIEKKDFYALWDGKGLFVSSFTKSKIKCKNENSYFKKERMILFTVQLLSIISALLFVFFVDDKFYFFIPVIFLSIFVILEILSKSFSFRLMNKIDGYFLDRLKEAPRNKNKFLERLEKYKVGIVTIPVKLFTFLLVAIFMIIIVVLNDLYNLIPLGIIFLSLLIECLILNPISKRKIERINKSERLLSKSRDVDSFKGNYKALHKFSYRFGNYTSIQKTIPVFLLVIANLLVMTFNYSISTSFLLFYTCLEFFIYDTIRRLISVINESQNLKEDFLRFHNQSCLDINNK